MIPSAIRHVPRIAGTVESGAFVGAGITVVPEGIGVMGFVGGEVAAWVAWMLFTVVAVTFAPAFTGRSSTPVFEKTSSTPTVLNALERAIAAALLFTLPVPVKLKITVPVFVFTTSPEKPLTSILNLLSDPGCWTKM